MNCIKTKRFGAIPTSNCSSSSMGSEINKNYSIFWRIMLIIPLSSTVTVGLSRQ